MGAEAQIPCASKSRSFDMNDAKSASTSDDAFEKRYGPAPEPDPDNADGDAYGFWVAQELVWNAAREHYFDEAVSECMLRVPEVFDGRDAVRELIEVFLRMKEGGDAK